MIVLYDIVIFLAAALLKVLALFNDKLALFVNGRKKVFATLASFSRNEKPILWMHCASLGEFEQGRPVLEAKAIQEKYQVVLTFFSPSGYEVQKHYNKAALVLYLPLDSKRNVRKFIKILNPSIAIFVKYEIWPNYLNELGKNNIKTLLISGIFRENQFLFSPLGAFIRKAMQQFEIVFVQDEKSKKLVEKIKIKDVKIAGDTRFDRVYEIVKQDNTLDFVSEFKANKPLLVAGSTWAEDEVLLVNYINTSLVDEKVIIAPHNINNEAIKKLKNSLTKKTILYSEMIGKQLTDYEVLIVDTVGLLTKVYSYATISYVGGGFGKAGIHNILEPATFGVPVVIAPNYYVFKEAVDLVEKNAIFVIQNQTDFNSIVKQLFEDNSLRKTKGNLLQKYIGNNAGATVKIVSYL